MRHILQSWETNLIFHREHSIPTNSSTDVWSVSNIASCFVRWKFLVSGGFSTRKFICLLELWHVCPTLSFLSRAFFNHLSVTSTGVFADGPGAYLFHGVVEQQYVFHVMDYALCLSESKQKSCERHVDRGGPNPKSMAAPSSLAAPSLYVLIIAASRLFIWHM